MKKLFIVWIIVVLLASLLLISVTSASSPVITLVSQTPSTLYQNSTGTFNVTWLVNCSNGLNTSSVAFVYTNYYTVDGSYNHSIRVPSNDRAAAYTNISDERILRADNRNGSLNFEDNTTITGGNVYEWGGGDENTSRMTISAINGTHSYVYWNGTVQDTVFQNMWYLDRTEQENATMTPYGIYKDHPLLAKIWSVEAIEDHDGYLFTLFVDAHLGAILPNKDLEIHYLNESYDPADSVQPEDFDYSFYITAHNATSWVDYMYLPHNSTYIEAFIVNQSAIENAGIEVTDTGYLYFTSSVAASKPYYLNVTDSASSCNRSFAENNVTFIGSSAPFSEYLYTPNIFVSDRHNEHQFQMKLFAADNNGYWGNSSLEITNIGVAYFPPTMPSISHFNYPVGTRDYDMDGCYSSTFDIGVGVATDPDGGTVTHNLTLHYANETFVAIINNTFTEADAGDGDPHALISFNSTPYYLETETYTMKVVAMDDEGKTSQSWLGVNFSLKAEIEIEKKAYYLGLFLTLIGLAICFFFYGTLDTDAWMYTNVLSTFLGGVTFFIVGFMSYVGIYGGNEIYQYGEVGLLFVIFGVIAVLYGFLQVIKVGMDEFGVGEEESDRDEKYEYT